MRIMHAAQSFFKCLPCTYYWRGSMCPIGEPSCKTCRFPTITQLVPACLTCCIAACLMHSQPASLTYIQTDIQTDTNTDRCKGMHTYIRIYVCIHEDHVSPFTLAVEASPPCLSHCMQHCAPFLSVASPFPSGDPGCQPVAAAQWLSHQ